MGSLGRGAEGAGGGAQAASYLGRHLLTGGLGPRLRVVQGRLGLGVSACGRRVMVVVVVELVWVLGAQVELCKASGDAAGLAERL